MMSALGKREQILGRAQEREGKAGAPVPTAAGLPQPCISHRLPTPHHPSQWLAWHAMSPFPHAFMHRHRQMGLQWQQPQ